MHSCVKQIHSSSTMNKHVWGTVMGTSSRCSTLVQVRKQSLKIRKSFQSSPNFCSLDGANALATRKVVHQAVASLRSCSETLASTCPGLSHAELLSGILAAACEYVESKICSFKARPLISPAFEKMRINKGERGITRERDALTGRPHGCAADV